MGRGDHRGEVTLALVPCGWLVHTRVVKPALAGIAALLALAGCGVGGPDVEAARTFDGYPLYWAGERFEGWDLEHVEVRPDGFSTFVYGTCDIPPFSDGGCAPPLSIQVQPLCAHLDAVAADPVWKRREVRGAPVGRIDGAPVLFASRVQVKAYWGQGADPGAPMRALEALESANGVAPVIGPGDPIPPASRAVLEGTAPCGA
ncbi:MAG: hypothetical protein KatS3mg012_0978 [Gaiellaceae bacterium]|nr:MAG: hypothetical protein KatS3mg012_0978 [Gaiellaceae bacterium]